MRIYIIIFFLFTFCSSGIAQATTQLTIRSETDDVKEVKLYISGDPVYGGGKFDEKNFNITESPAQYIYTSDKVKSLIIESDSLYEILYLLPSNNLTVTILNSKEVKYSGKGAANQKFYQWFRENVDEDYDFLIDFKEDHAYEEVYEKYMELQKKEQKLLKKGAKQYGIDVGFQKYMQQIITYRPYRSLFFVAMDKKEFNPWLKQVEQLNLNNDYAAANSDDYNDMIYYYVYQSFRDETDSIAKEKFSLNQFKYGADKLSGETKESYMAYALNRSEQGKKIEDFLEIYKIYTVEAKNESLKAEMADAKITLEELQQTPIPAGANIIEKQFASVDEVFAQYKGKVIYVDFWASWCGPCKRAMPAAKELQKKMAGKDVAFIYLAYNDRTEPWLATIKSLQITGDHIFLSKELMKQFNDKFDIRYIPRYVLVDKNGQVTSDNAPRPYDPKVEEMILNMLK